jgi:succinyl-CoA synthetase beta subunit
MELIKFEEAENILSKYEMPFPRTVFISSKNEISKNLKGFKYPVFLKIYGKDILHRTDIGGVGEAENEKDVKKLFSKMTKIEGAEGVLIQEKVDGKSLIVGMRRDAQFGPVIMAGIGGIFAEILKDVVLRVAPVSETEALKMLSELKGYKYLLGERDHEAVNLEAVAKIIASLSELSLKEEEISQIDLNPVIANDKKALAVDFKFLI